MLFGNMFYYISLSFRDISFQSWKTLLTSAILDIHNYAYMTSHPGSRNFFSLELQVDVKLKLHVMQTAHLYLKRTSLVITVPRI